MNVISDIRKIKTRFSNLVLAIGVFDGLHVGHQALIRQAVRRAKIIHGKTAVLTFFPHPLHVLRPEIYLPLIISLPHRIKLIEELGVDACMVVKFTKSFSRLSPKAFIEQYLMKRLKPTEVFVGEDFRFGQNRRGTLEFFKHEGERRGFHVNIFRPVKEKKGKIGSTLIRQLIIDGQLKEASHLLGRPVSIMGKVIVGNRRGQRLGFPTANIDPDNIVIPPVGVYAASVMINRKIYGAMANIGHRPSFDQADSKINVEIHIFDFEKNLYGKEIIVEFIKKIREEKIFFSPQKLIDQLKKDEQQARRRLRKYR